MGFFESVRRPEYTGANRCWPCTVANAGIVVGVGILAAIVTPLLSIFVVAVGVTILALRGYVIPYTPRVAPRLLALLGLEASFFSHTERTVGGIGGDSVDGDTVIAALGEAGVLTGGEELALSPDFAHDWHNAIDDVDRESLADAVADAAVTPVQARRFDNDGRTWIIVTDEDGSVASERWLSRPIAIADVAAVRTLKETGVDTRIAVAAAASLRLFLDECPDCGGRVVETTGDGCCGGFGPSGPDHVLACEDCDQRLATLD
ncbi:hypothetical protein [Halocatena marina]|uniref:hypothetical protein n=1 Tax=Halocatena marina TaxID=2934937 RepID=UPI002010A7D1|nr:hypothetical protein [Halocatena marina]